MKMRYLMGIDGGGSSLRIAVVDDNLTAYSEYHASTSVNPMAVGPEHAARVIQDGIRAALTRANLTSAEIKAVGIGVAGALTGEMPHWLNTVVGKALPGVPVVTASDSEIALTGAHGKRQGILVIAGTGSIVLGINSSGQSCLVGGWGYLVGDEGSGFWLGREALRAAARAVDGRGPASPLTAELLSRESFKSRDSLVEWVYRTPVNIREIAQLAPLVLQYAAVKDGIALPLVEAAADELALAVRTVQHTVAEDALRIAFGGGLLAAPNSLSERLCQRLSLSAFPVSRYPAAVGAAILAQGAN